MLGLVTGGNSHKDGVIIHVAGEDVVVRVIIHARARRCSCLPGRSATPYELASERHRGSPRPTLWVRGAEPGLSKAVVAEVEGPQAAAAA